MLEGGEFLLFTDHKPLTSALFRSSPPWSARQQRHLACIAKFMSSIVRVPGLENTVADALSRPSPTPAVPPGFSSPISPLQLHTPMSSHTALDPPPAPEVSVVSAVSVVSVVSAVSAMSDSLPPSPSINQSTSQDFTVQGFDFSQILSLQKTCSSIQTMKNLSSLSM